MTPRLYLKLRSVRLWFYVKELVIRSPGVSNRTDKGSGKVP